jgi:hypothetical protein
MTAFADADDLRDDLTFGLAAEDAVLALLHPIDVEGPVMLGVVSINTVGSVHDFLDEWILRGLEQFALVKPVEEGVDCAEVEVKYHAINITCEKQIYIGSLEFLRERVVLLPTKARRKSIR